MSASIGVLGGWEVMFRLAYLLLALYGLSLGWAFLAASSLVLDRRPLVARSQVGRALPQELTLRSHLPLWVPWVEVRDGSSLPGDGIERVVSLSPRSSRTWTGQSTCRRRGQVEVGPTWLRTGDPFGLFAIEREIQPTQSVVVLPETVPVSYSIPGGSQEPSGTTEPQPSPTPSSATRSVRDYRPGDPLRHVHWASAARLGRLMVREFEPDRGTDVCLVLDLHAGVQAGNGRESTEEYAVTATASLFAHLLGRGAAVGLVSQEIVVEPGRGQAHLLDGLERLALARTQRWPRLSELLVRQRDVLRHAGGIVIVTPAHTSTWLRAALPLFQGNQGLELVQVEAPEASARGARGLGDRPASDLPFPVHVWRHGPSLDSPLAAGRKPGLAHVPAWGQS